MRITLKDGTTLEALGVHGRQMDYQGINRDSLIFLFDPENLNLDQIAAAFTEANCEKIVLSDADGEYVHEHYTIRIDYGCGYQDAILMNQNVVRDGEKVNFVRMAQSTMTERQLERQQEVLDALLVAQLEGGAM